MESFPAKEGGETLTMHASARRTDQGAPGRDGEIAMPASCSPISRWPVLARIPDVTALTNSRPQRRRPTAAAQTRGVDYRVDPPQPRAEHELAATAVDEVHTQGSSVAQPSPPAHHWFRRSAAPRTTSRAAHRASSVLPDSNPFSLSSEGIEDRLAPIIRFMVVAALFAIAGMSVLLIYRLGPEPEPSTAPARGASAQRTDLAPTAAGPLAAAISSDSSHESAPREDSSANSRAMDNPVRPPDIADTRVNPTFDTQKLILEPPPLTMSPTELPYPTTGYPAVAIDEIQEFIAPGRPHPAADASSIAGDPVVGFTTAQPPTSTELPRVRTDAPAPAVARFSGQVQPVPTRQAQHDKYESSVY